MEENNISKSYTVFTSKQLRDKQRKSYYAKYPTFSYKRGDTVFVVVCHGDMTIL
jgi:hypothetical protein